MDKFCKFILEPFLFIFYLVMVTIMFIQIFCRYLLGFSFTWVEECSLYIYIWIVFISASLGFLKGIHISLEFFIEAMGKKASKIIYYFSIIAQISLFLFIFIQGINFVKVGARQLCTSIPMKRSIIYSVIPISSLLMILNTLYNVFFRKNKKLGGIK